MNSFEATVALSKYVEDHFSTLPVFSDSTAQPDPATDVTLANGWVELHFDFGEKGPSGGRSGPSATYYSSVAAMTCMVLTPKEQGDGPARSASAALEDLLLGLTVGGDITVVGTRESIAPLMPDDTHVQIDRIFTLDVEDLV